MHIWAGYSHVDVTVCRRMCTHMFVCIMQIIWERLHPNGGWAMLKSTELTSLQGLLFNSPRLFPLWRNVTVSSFCIFYGSKSFTQVESNDPQTAIPASIHFSASLSKGSQKLLLWQQSEPVNCQLKDRSRTSWNLLGHGWKKTITWKRNSDCLF